MKNEQHTAFEDVIDELLMAEPEPSHEVLTRWTERHPEHRDTLAKFFATWAVQTAMKAESPLDEARSGSVMVSQALKLLQQKRAVAASAAQAQQLTEVLKKRGLNTDDVAARCGIDDSILMKLARRRINFWSIPQMLFERFAAVLESAAEAIRPLFDGGPVPLRAHKAIEKPEIKTEDFIDAVNSSDLSEAAKAEWRRVIQEEKRSGGIP